jgi:hypothetical protein
MPTGEGFLVAQLAALDALIDGPFGTVLIKSVEQGRLVIQAADRSSVEAFLNAIASCKPMRLLLLNGNGAEPLLELPIPNDAQYLDAAKVYFSRANEKYPVGHGLAQELLGRDEAPAETSMRSEGLHTILFLCAIIWLGGRAISAASPYSTTDLDLVTVTDAAGVIAILLGLVSLEDNPPPNQLYCATDGLTLTAIPTASVDFAFSLSTLNHLIRKKYLAGMFDEIYRVLKAGGTARINVRSFPDKPFGDVRWWKSFDRGYFAFTRVRGITIPFFRLFDPQYGVCVNEEQLLAMTRRFTSAKPWREGKRRDLWIDLVK